MKLIFAVVQSHDVEACSDALTAAGFVCTRFDTQGGFLDSTNSTLMTGVDDAQVEQVLDVLRRHAKRRVEMLDSTVPIAGALTPVLAPPLDVEVGGATVFVLPLDRCEKL
ncbi:MAG: cyclic-di-AMP receptor [Candidatus Dormibacteraeota bacterium]|nr:cyclic-di-AMP receptor [Candidatus Dormibacteraeota bacterium]